MKVLTSKLTDDALDWAVATAAIQSGGLPIYMRWYTDGRPNKPHWGESGSSESFRPSTNWSQGGPIIEREGITVVRCEDDFACDAEGFTTNERIPLWAATSRQHSAVTTHDRYGARIGYAYEVDANAAMHGPTPLIAAMRCFVAQRLGKEVEVPDELLRQQQQVVSPNEAGDAATFPRGKPRAG